MNFTWLEISIFGMATMLATLDVLTLGGIDISNIDLITLIILSFVASVFATSFGKVKRSWRAGLANIVLGVFVGILTAHLVIVALPINENALISLAPLFSMSSAKFARENIFKDNDTMNQIWSSIWSRFLGPK